MKVLMLVSWYSSHYAETLSTGVFHYEQAMALKKYCSTAIYFPFDTDIKGKFLSSDENGMRVFRSRPDTLKTVDVLKRCFKDFKKILKKFKPDIIHAHVASAAGVIAVILGKIYKIPVVITEHNPVELYSLDKKRMWLKTGFAYHNSKRNICVSKDSMRKMKKIFPKEKFELIYNGIINPKDIKMENTKYKVDDKINFCIVASFYSDTIKGYQYLLPAIKIIKERNKNIMLHIVGGGTYLEKYKKLAKELDIEDCCTFYGNCERSKVYSIVSQMEFQISSSIFECSGVSVQEAMLLGKPLVVTKSGGANSLVTKDTAIVVERESVEALVKGIETMFLRKDKFNPAVIKKYAFENFEIDEVSKRYMKLYKEVLEEKKCI